MPNLNKVMLMGNITRSPEVKYTPKGTAVAQFGLAINRQWKNEAGEKQEEVTFVDVEFFGRKAEVIGEYCKKGDPIFVECRLKLDIWDDKETGNKRSKLKVIGESFEFLGSKKGGDEYDQRQERPQPQRQQQPPARRPAPPVDPGLDEDPDLIPF